MKFFSILPAWCGLTLTGILISYSLSAEVQSLTITANVFEAAPCNITKPVTVSFDEVWRDRVDSKNYIRPINYQFDCSLAPGDVHTLSLMLIGNSASFDSTAISTNKPGLAIRLMQTGSGKVFAVNRWIDFTWPDFPQLQAVPIADPNVTLTSGEFNASATLLVVYQ